MSRNSAIVLQMRNELRRDDRSLFRRGAAIICDH